MSEGTGPERPKRRLFGSYRATDVDAALAERDAIIEDLRRDMTALWAAFGNTEKAVEELRGQVENAGWSGASDAPVDEPETRPDRSGQFKAQLEELDQVLEAIQEATEALHGAHGEASESEPEED